MFGKTWKNYTQGFGGVNVDTWAKKVLDTLDTYPYMEVEELGIGEYLT